MLIASGFGRSWHHRLGATAQPCAIKDGARLGTLSWKPCPLRARESAEHARELLANRCRLSLMRCTRTLLRGCRDGSVLKTAASKRAWAQSSFDVSSLVASMLSARPSTAGGHQQRRSLRQWLLDHRWTLAANTACSLQMLQWSMDDPLYLRSINILAIGFFTLYNSHMAAWTYVGWDAAYTLINAVQIGRILRERREVRLLPWQAEVHARAFEGGGLSTRQARTLLDHAEPERLLRPGERFALQKGGDRGGAARPHAVGLVLSGTLKVEGEDGQIVGFVDQFGWCAPHLNAARAAPAHASPPLTSPPYSRWPSGLGTCSSTCRSTRG